MKVNTNSWHYRLNDRFYSSWWRSKPRSLCRYFWQTVWSLLVVSSLALIAAWFAAALAAGLLAASFGLTMPAPLGESAIAVTALATLASASLTIALILSLCEDLVSKHRRVPVKEPGLALSYLKAAKQKVCPTIEYVED